MIKTIEYKILDCGFNAPAGICEYEFKKSINELAKDRWEPLFPISKYRIIMARTIAPPYSQSKLRNTQEQTCQPIPGSP